jgi:hypothetical protein
MPVGIEDPRLLRCDGLPQVLAEEQLTHDDEEYGIP